MVELEYLFLIILLGVMHRLFFVGCYANLLFNEVTYIGISCSFLFSFNYNACLLLVSIYSILLSFSRIT